MAEEADHTISGATTRQGVDAKAHVEPILKIVVASIGLAYGTGFVVVLTFLNAYGIREVGGDFFKLKYVYVGALCLACPAAMVGILLALFSGRHRISVSAPASTFGHVFGRLFAPAENVPLPLILVVVNLIVVFYCVIAFAHPGLFAAKQTLFNCLYLPLVAMLGLRLIVGEPGLWSRRLNAIRWVLVAISIWISVVILADIDFASMFKERAHNYLILQILFVIFMYRFTKWPLLGSDGRERAARLLVRIMVLGSLFVLGVFSFAHTVFNHIPAEKGGGDFSHASDSQVCFSEAFRTSIPATLLQDVNAKPLCTQPVKIIEETATDIYVARSSDRGNRAQRVAPNPAALWRSGAYYPVVFDLNRSAISAIVILNRGTIELAPAPGGSGKAIPGKAVSAPAFNSSKTVH